MEEIIKKSLIEGQWNIEDSKITYLGPFKPSPNHPVPSFGLLLFSKKMKRGSIKTKVSFSMDGGTGRIVLGYDAKSKGYYSVGIGGYNYAYVVDRFDRGIWHAVASYGDHRVIKGNRTYEIEVTLDGQRLILRIDDNEIFDVILDAKKIGKQIGLFSWGKEVSAIFEDITINPLNPKAFVIIKYNKTFDKIFNKIREICNDENIMFDAYRAKDVYKPGIIMKDIIKGIVESEILIADITIVKHDENVYYEVGYAHALGKQVILLAKKSSKRPPFDISNYRVIYYDRIKGRGKEKFEKELKKHLISIKQS